VHHAVELAQQWPVDAVAAASVIDGEVIVVGSREMQFPLASLTKLATALGVLIAVEEGTVGLDDDIASVIDRPDLGPLPLDEVLSHCSGLAPDAPPRRMAPEHQRRIYSNAGYELAAAAVERRSGIAFGDYLQEAVFAPLAMASTTLIGSPASGATSTIDDAIVRKPAPPRAAIQIPAASRGTQASQRPSGDIRPRLAPRCRSRGSPPSVGTSYTFEPPWSRAVNTMCVSSGEKERCEYSRSPLVSCSAAPPICWVQICGVLPS